MSDEKFLLGLKAKRRIELVEPSFILKDSYIKKSDSSIESAKILLENKKFEESVVLIYYSMYHMLTALLYLNGIKCENHAGSIILLKDLFNIDNSEISSAKSERVDKQYYTDFSIKAQEVMLAVKDAEQFNAELLDFISRIGNKDVIDYRQRLNNMLNKIRNKK